METYLREIDKIQRDKVKSLIYKNMFIEAGAGAGKTSIIIDRIINQLKADFSPSEIVVITFTNAATEEIRGRITKGLSDAIKNEVDSKIKDKLLNAYKNMYSMNISTIHSFCNKLLSEKCFSAKLPLGLELIQDDDELDRRKKIFGEWFNKLSTKDFKILYSLNKSGIWKIKEDIYDQYNSYVSAGEGLDIVLPEIRNDYFDEALQVALDCYNYIDSFNSNSPNKILKQLIVLYDELMHEKKSINTFRYQEEFVKLIALFLRVDGKGKYTYAPYTSRGSGKEANEKIREYINEKNIEKYAILNDIYIKGNIAKYAKEAYTYFYEAVKFDRERISNDQLLTYTNNLVDDYEARKYFAKKIKCIYVDEFQDTDMIQASFIWGLACDTITDQRTRLRDGALFVVGDPKQSIYRFRGADPEVFFEIKERMSKLDNAEVFFFSNNFRSNNEIIDTVNNYYHSIELVDKGTYQDMIVPLNHIAPIKLNNKQLSGAYIMNCQTGVSDDEKVAKLVKALINNGYQIPRPKDGKKENEYIFDNVKEDDIAIIIGKHSGMQGYVNELNKLGITVKVNGEVWPKSEKLLTVYLRLLRSIIYKNDYMSDFGALEALRFSGISYPDKFTQEAEVEDYYRDILKKIKSKFNGMSSYARAYSLASHLEYILPKNEDILVGNIISIQTKLQQMLENNFKDKFLNGVELIASIEKYINEGLKSELAIMDSKAVRLMNVHQSKGLEGEIVIYASNDSKASFNNFDYRHKKTYYPTISYIYDEDTTIINNATREHNLEKNRLEYVAITRAKQVIIFDNELKEDYLFNREEANYELDSLQPLSFDIDTTSEEKEVKTIEFDINIDNTKDETLSMPLYKKLNPSSLDNSISKIREDEKKKIIAMNEDPTDYIKGRPYGAALGTILHRAFELLVNRYKTTDDLSICVNQAINENLGIINKGSYQYFEKFIGVTIKAYKEYLDNNKLLDKYSKISTEMPYSYYDKESNTWTNGTMDLLLVNPNSDALVIDYKSDVAEYIKDDSLFEETLKEKYTDQVKAYKDAINILFNIDISNIKTKIIYVRRYNDDEQTVEIKELDL